nr:ATP-binding cassette domain-containing protein [Candidatus Sigynarchaeota archaeon]
MTVIPILDLQGVSWIAGGRAILHDISFSVSPGEFISIIGPSGCGKSSLLKIIVRLIDATSGIIHYQGREINDIDIIQLRRQIGLILQDSHMFDGTVRDNLTYGSRLQKKDLDEAKMLRLLSDVHLPPEILEQDAGKLSGGERQRVAIVRMLMNEPAILLLDEITSALDLSNALMVEGLIKQLQASTGITILMVSHDFEQAKRIGGTAMFMVNGTIIETGKASDLFSHPQHESTARFLAGGIV